MHIVCDKTHLAVTVLAASLSVSDPASSDESSGSANEQAQRLVGREKAGCFQAEDNKLVVYKTN